MQTQNITLPLGFDYGDLEKVNKRWLVDLLSTLNPNHRYFLKSYYPSPEELRDVDPEDVNAQYIDNSDGLLNDLPTNHQFKSKKKGMIFKASKEKLPVAMTKRNFKELLARAGIY